MAIWFFLLKIQRLLGHLTCGKQTTLHYYIFDYMFLQTEHFDINAGKAESKGMYLDEGTTIVTVASNLIYDIAKSPLRFHRANTPLVQENVLVCGEGIPPVRYNRTEVRDIVLKGNVILHETIFIIH